MNFNSRDSSLDLTRTKIYILYVDNKANCFSNNKFELISKLHSLKKGVCADYVNSYNIFEHEDKNIVKVYVQYKNWVCNHDRLLVTYEIQEIPYVL